MIRSTKVEFVKKASKIHNNFYEYSKVKYKNNCTKVCIISFMENFGKNREII